MLILGVSSGFGAASALRLAAAGFNIAGVHLDRRAGRPRVERLRSDLEALGAHVLLFNANATTAETRSTVTEALADACEETGGVLRLLLHSLAFGSMGPLTGATRSAEIPALSPRQLAMTQDVMASSLIWWTRDLLVRNLLTAGARVVALTSMGAQRVVPDYGAVAAAKAALEAHVRQLAVELGPRGVTVNALRAGVTDTPALRQIPGADDLLAGAAARNPSGRLTRPDDVARLLPALLNPAFDWVTGNVIGVDGGEGIVV